MKLLLEKQKKKEKENLHLKNFSYLKKKKKTSPVYHMTQQAHSWAYTQRKA